MGFIPTILRDSNRGLNHKLVLRLVFYQEYAYKEILEFTFCPLVASNDVHVLFNLFSCLEMFRFN